MRHLVEAVDSPFAAYALFQIPRSTIHKILLKKLPLYADKKQLLQALKPEDKPRVKEFVVSMLDGLGLNYGKKLIISWLASVRMIVRT